MQRDLRVVEVSELPARYDQIADLYETFAPDVYVEPPITSLLSLVGEVSRLRLLDLACGHGRMARELARRGARVTGIDISAAHLDKARSLEQTQPLGIAYVPANAASAHALEGELFDGVVCHFGLSDIDDLDGVIATVARVLRPCGFFTFSIVHPCFPGWEAKGASPSWPLRRGYFAEGWWLSSGPPGGVRTKVGANHRMLSTYLNALARNRLLIEEVREPEPPPDWLEIAPSVGAVPIYFVARCRRD